MAVIAVSGEAGCRIEEVARLAGLRLGFAYVSEATLRQLIVEDFGGEIQIPDAAYPSAVTAVVAKLARERSLVFSAAGAELLVAGFPAVLRVGMTVPLRYRIGNMMLEHRLDRPQAQRLIEQLDAEDRVLRKRRFRRISSPPHLFDLIINTEHLDTDQAAGIVETAARQRGFPEHGPLTVGQEAELQFQARLKLARHGIAPAGKAALPKRPFVNESEEIFANLLNFYRIDWQYEPRSFGIQWDAAGRVTESFTPDFYLPEFDLFIELTTMKQANVTKKNRKIKLLKTIYPHINIQVFYQKDFQNLVFKYGLTERAPVA
ncbi:MAG: cytidylate kinase family protein [Bryobacterales bacterium]|nr:cytidylate kinase family protein [Bryobacterales bacterium]